MDANGVAIDDLYAAALPRIAEIQLPSNVHFNAAGWEVLGKQAASAILAELPRKR